MNIPNPKNPANSASSAKVKVRLINLGGPRHAAEVEPFLVDLLTDPLMVDMPLPFFIQKPLMSYVARKRAIKVAHKYESMGFGGGSPIVAETERQARSLQERLSSLAPQVNWEIVVSMTCGSPNVRDLSPVDLIPAQNNIILPLYPQFSRSTTMSFGRIAAQVSGQCPLSRAGCIAPFYNDQRYHQAIADLILEHWQRGLDPQYFIQLDASRSSVDWRRNTLLFSAHGIPMRLIHKGDQYQKQIEANAQAITKILRKQGFSGEMHISYQSRLGRGKWTSPSTIAKLTELGQADHQNVSVYPISFVSDHLETLEEIETELRAVALTAGISNFQRLPAPGTWPPFIEFLAQLVLAHSQDAQADDRCQCLEMGGERLRACSH
ncbi:MAG: ferrochelatase [Leptospiraceae bacterium]|nr:ferrochelatase [Leptospiraceae bacterium]